LIFPSISSGVIDGSISTGVCNAASNAGGNLLKLVEMQHKYGSARAQGEHKDLSLVPTQS
jgi:hypothetical protein